LEKPNKIELEAGRLLFAQQCNFVVSAASSAQLPPSKLPEVAFAGRSNVGKSSLVNALTGRKTLAKTSNQPGRTRLLNFFELGERLVLVDLPGYGYARAAKSDIKRWTELTLDYLKGRAELRRVCLLIDARHGLKASDRRVMDVLDEAAVSYQLVLTKADKVKAATLTKIADAVALEARNHVAAHPELAITSAQKTLGLAELRTALTALAESASDS
jgi:GTP-binding protein